METRRSSKRKEREEAPPSGTQQTSRKTQRVSKASPAAPNREASEVAASGNTLQSASAREIERPNSSSGGPVTRLRSRRAAAATAQAPSATAGRTKRTRAKARDPSAEAEERQQPKEETEAALPQAAQPNSQPAPAPASEAAAPAPEAAAPAEAEKANSGARRLTPSQLREMANRQGRGQGIDDEKDLAEVFGRNFSGAGSALQGLLRKLGAAGFDDMMPMGGVSGSRMKAIMQGLRQTEDEGAQLSSLSELNELLSISTEDNLAAFPTESMVPLLIQLLNSEQNADIMLMAARALTFLADVLPQSCGAIVRHGAVPAFCARLLTIEYIDLAEQSLQALEKLSHEHATALLQNGGLLAVLSYLDFFPTGVQRTATATAANICRSLAMSPSAACSSAAQAAVKEAIPILTGLLHYSDAKVVDNACVSLSYIAEASAGQPTLLQALTSGDLVAEALQLIGLSETGAMTSQLSLSTYYGLLKLLATAAASSASVAITLLGTGALSTARTLLATSPLLMAGPNAGGGGAALLRTPDQMHEVLGLLTELLPMVPDSQTLMASGAAVELPQTQTQSGEAGTVKAGAMVGSGGRQGAVASAARGGELLGYLSANPSVTAQLCNDILPLVLSSYSATVISEVRARALRVLLQILVACPAAQLREALRDLPLAAFLAALLAVRDTATLAAALHCCEVLMAQLPDVFKHVFLKEGVAYAIEQIASSAPATPAIGVSSPTPPPVLSAPPNPVAARGGTTASAVEEARRAVSRSPPLATARVEKPQPQPSTTAAVAAASPVAALATAAANAAAASRIPPSSPGGASLRAALAARAMSFKRAHYDTGCGAPETEGLVRVRSLLQRLPSEPTVTLSQLLMVMAASPTSTSTSSNAAVVSDPSGQTLPRGTSVSVFELLNSGAVKTLYDFLTGADLSAAMSSAAVEERATTILRRIAALTRAGLTPADGAPCNPPLVGLVRKLQAALSSAETFPVHYGRAVPPSGSGSFRGGAGYGSRGGSAGSASAMNPGSLSSGLSLLTHPFKLRLCRHGSDNSLRDYSSNIVLIEPLATMMAIEEFLYPRVYRGTSAASQQQGSAAAPGGGANANTATAAAATGATADGAGSKGAGTGATTGGASAATPGGDNGGGTATASATPLPGSRSHPIQMDDGVASNRRVTRSQAARERAEAEEAARRRGALPVPAGRGGKRRTVGAAAGDSSSSKDGVSGGSTGPVGGAAGAVGGTDTGGGESTGRDYRMTDVGDDAEEEDDAGRMGRRSSRSRVGGGGSEPEVDDDDMDEGDGDADMDDAGAGGDAMFDEDDEDFDEDAMDGDDGDGDIGNLHVHDLHVDQDRSAAQHPPSGNATAPQSGGCRCTWTARRSLGRPVRRRCRSRSGRSWRRHRIRRWAFSRPRGRGREACVLHE
ncbi:hypothetical protein Vretimale_14948 [Volvox reticuliferus]|nr:hypothetical protein Vretimale_14948 [Volvox reticuliferus]